MQKHFEFSRKLIAFLIVTTLLFPFIVIAFRFPFFQMPIGQGLVLVLGNTALQAVLSALGSLVFGVLGGCGIFWSIGKFGIRYTRIFEGLALIPNAAPVLLMILAVSKFFPWARGLSGIVFVHICLNTGLVAVAFVHLVQTKTAGFSKLAYVEGAGGLRFFIKGVLPFLRIDLTLIGLFIFAISFSGFAVPLALGGANATTIEVLIYQKIRISGDWSEALGLSLIQATFIFIFSMFSWRDESAAMSTYRMRAHLLEFKYGLIFVLVPVGLLLIALLDGLEKGIRQFLTASSVIADIPELFAGSVVVSFSTGVVTVVALQCLAFVRPKGAFRKFLIGYAAPSSVLVGFSLLVVWRALGLASYFKIGLGLCMIMLPAFYRFRWAGLLRSLNGQVRIAESLGSNPWLTYMRIVMPQTLRPSFIIGGTAAFWAWGDFALSSVIAERNLTIAQVAHGMMETYRFEMATVFVWIVMAGGLVTFVIFAGVGNVLGSQSQV